jgi:hypothetical protein
MEKHSTSRTSKRYINSPNSLRVDRLSLLRLSACRRLFYPFGRCWKPALRLLTRTHNWSRNAPTPNRGSTRWRIAARQIREGVYPPSRPPHLVIPNGHFSKWKRPARSSRTGRSTIYDATVGQRSEWWVIPRHRSSASPPSCHLSPTKRGPLPRRRHPGGSPNHSGPRRCGILSHS